MPISPNDLTQRPPRSARVRLGGYAILPRCLDKGRATIQGKNGEYHYNCPLDQMVLSFAGIDAEELKAQLAQGKSDTEILEWIQATAKSKRTPFEIHAWSAWAEQRVPTELEGREFFSSIHKAAGPNRKDIATWFDVLDMDDYASYGGKA